MNFETTMNEADFERALLDTKEMRMLRDMQPEPDLSVDGLHSSLLAQVLNLFGAGRR